MRTVFLVLAAFCACALLSGCASYYEISDVIPTTVMVEGGEKPLAAVHVDNVSYRFLYFIPFCSGIMPEELKDDYGHGDFRFFTDQATIDNNLKTIKAATKFLGSDRISNVITVTDDSSLWSLFLFNRHTVRTSCIVLGQ